MKPVLLLALLLTYPSILAQEKQPVALKQQNLIRESGAIVRGDTTEQTLALIFTGDAYAEGAQYIIKALNEHDVKASFFFTGNFYRNPEFKELIEELVTQDHYLGAHSDKHLLYNDWTNRDSLLVTREEFREDLWNNYREMKKFGISPKDAPFFLPPYEWYNDSISSWTRKEGFHLINITHGTLSHADYTTPDMANYRDSPEIYNSILSYEESSSHGLNGFLLLIHLGVGPDRTDKFHHYLPQLLTELTARGYSFSRVDQLLTRP